MWKSCRSLDPRKPSKKRYFGKSLLDFARQQERRGEKAGTRRKRPPTLPRALPATRSNSVTRIPTQSLDLSSSFSGRSIINTALEHAELGATAHNNQIVLPDAILQSELEHHDSFEISQHPSTTATTSFASTLGENSHDISTTFTTQSTNLGESSLTNEGLLSELSPLASWTQRWTPSASLTQGDLNQRPYQDYWDWYNPSAMMPAELGQYIPDMNRDVRGPALPPTQDLLSDTESYRVKATYANGHQSREALQFNYQSRLNFAPQAFLSKLREDSQSPIDIFRTPPGRERWGVTPDGIVAPLEFYLWAYLEYESPRIPFPSNWVCLWVYNGTGAADDTKITLGHAYFNTLESQALV